MNYRDKPNLRDSSRERVHASIDKSLKNLGTDWVDVYLVHWPDRETPFEETMQALEEVVRDGKVRHVGLSNFKLEEIEACRQAFRVDVVQYGWNMFDRRMQREILPYCQEHEHRVHGVRVAVLRPAHGHVHRGHRLRRGRLALPQGQHGLDQDVRGAVRGGDVPGQRAGGRGAEEHRRPVRQEPPAAGAAVGDLPPGREHRARGLPEHRRGGGQRRARSGWSISAADLAEIDAIFDSHGIDTTPEFWIEEA